MTLFTTRLLRTALAFLLLAGTTALAQQAPFIVNVATKNATHPEFGVGESMGYVIDGVQGKELTLERNTTYVFQMDNVHSDHPFYISTSPVGEGLGMYNDGVENNSAVGNEQLRFTPTDATPDLLYYQCEAHENMGWRINIVDQTTGVDREGMTLGLLSTVTPNPVSTESLVTVTAPRGGNARVSLHTADGREVFLLHNGPLDAGRHTFPLDATRLAAGAYRLHVAGESYRAAQTVAVVK